MWGQIPRSSKWSKKDVNFEDLGSHGSRDLTEDTCLPLPFPRETCPLSHTPVLVLALCPEAARKPFLPRMGVMLMR